VSLAEKLLHPRMPSMPVPAAICLDCLRPDVGCHQCGKVQASEVVSVTNELSAQLRRNLFIDYAGFR
jgi:hypothetical protein